MINYLEQLLEKESNLVQHWLSNDVPLKKATDEWFKGIGGVVAPYEPCANFKNEIDRVDYARYLFTGYIFEEEEKNLSSGNRTMFAIPLNLKVTKTPGENFFYFFDNPSNTNFEYKDSLKLSVDNFVIGKIETLKDLVSKEKLVMTFEQGFVSRKNSELIAKIKNLNPYTIDWSNIPDYLTREDFLFLAKEMSGKETVHYMHFMNWTNQVPGKVIHLMYSKH